MTIWRTRIDLARDGWRTSLRLQPGRHGNSGSLGFWARTGHWSGRLSDVCFHAHAVLANDVDCETVVDAAKRIVDTVARTALTARAEWPDEVPCALHNQTRPDGRMMLAQHSTETAYIRARPRDVFPTEAIAPGTGTWVGTEDALVHAMHAAFAAGHSVENDVRIAYKPGQMPRDVAERAWTFEAQLAVHQHAGTAVAYQPIRVRGPILEEAAAAGLTRTLLDDTTALFAAYAPGGEAAGATTNGLPPGFQTLAEYKAISDARIAASGIED